MAEKASDSLDIIWGVESIGKFIGRTERQAFFLLSNGEIPGKKVAGRWCASKTKLTAFFNDEAA